MGSFDLAQLGLSGAEAETFYDDVLDRVSGLPGVAAAALGDRTLLWKFHGVGKNERNSVVVRLPEELPGEGRVELGGYAGGRFLETLGLEVMRGRGLVAADDGIRPRVGVLTAPLAEQLFEGPGVGRTLWVQALDQDEASAVEIEIVGVVEAPVDPSYAGGRIRAVFLPAPLREETALTLYVRSVGPADALRPLVREVIREVDARVPVLEPASLDSVQERDEFVERGLARAAAFLGLVALLLATVGLYGVTSYVVVLRTRELAIRLAIGALPRQVLRIVLDQSLGLVALGGVIGGVIAAGVGALIQAQAFGVAGVDWAALLGSALLLVLVMLFASAVPARRAARLDPGRVLREG
jgi:hypothetical protein